MKGDFYPYPFPVDPFRQLIYRPEDAEDWFISHRVESDSEHVLHGDLISELRDYKYPAWASDFESPYWERCRDTAVTGRQDMVSRELPFMIETQNSNWPEHQVQNSEIDAEVFIQVLINTMQLAGGLKDHLNHNIDPDFEASRWASIYNAYFYELATDNAHEPVDIDFGVQWIIPTWDVSLESDPMEPKHIMADAVFSVSMNMPTKLVRSSTLFATPACPNPSECTSVLVPFIAVEYVKIFSDYEAGRDIHEQHLSGALYTMTATYEALKLDLPVFGLLIDKRETTLYIGALCPESAADGGKMDLRPIMRFEHDRSYGTFEFCLVMDKLIQHAGKVRRAFGSVTRSPQL